MKFWLKMICYIAVWKDQKETRDDPFLRSHSLIYIFKGHTNSNLYPLRPNQLWSPASEAIPTLFSILRSHTNSDLQPQRPYQLQPRPQNVCHFDAAFILKWQIAEKIWMGVEVIQQLTSKCQETKKILSNIWTKLLHFKYLLLLRLNR